MGKLGVENIVKVLDVVVEVGNVADKFSHTDGMANKAAHLLSLTDELLAIPGIHFDQVSLEYTDLDAAEKAELLTHMKAKFDIADDELEIVIESALALVVDLDGLVRQALVLANALKKK